MSACRFDGGYCTVHFPTTYGAEPTYCAHAAAELERRVEESNQKAVAWELYHCERIRDLESRFATVNDLIRRIAKALLGREDVYGLDVIDAVRDLKDRLATLERERDKLHSELADQLNAADLRRQLATLELEKAEWIDRYEKTAQAVFDERERLAQAEATVASRDAKIKELEDQLAERS